MNSTPDNSDDRIIDSASYISVAAVLVLGVCGVGLWWLGGNPQDDRANLSMQPLVVYPPTKFNSNRSMIPQVLLTDVTLAAGIDFRHERGASGDFRLPEAMGGGCVVLDYDLDGDQDILLIHSQMGVSERSSLVLYANDGTGRFQDVTELTGLSLNVVGMGGSAADFDNDGWPDLFITCVGSNHLLHNLDGWFQDITTSANVGGCDSAWSMPSCWLDYDRDGYLDLFVGNYLTWSAELDRDLNCCRNGVDRSYCDPDLFAGVQPYLYQNNGDETFRDVTGEVGLDVRNPDTGQAVPKSLAAITTDLNGDSWPDLVVTGDGTQNLAFINLRNGRFRENGTELGIAFDRLGQATRTFGLDAANLPDSKSFAICMGGRGNGLKLLHVKRFDEALFTDHGLISGWAGPARRVLTFGTCFVDVDLDGQLDLFTANGQIHEDFEQLQQSQTWRQSPQLYWQSSIERPRFEAMSSQECGEELGRPMSGRGTCFGDFDSDGDLDLLLTANGDRPRLLRNDQQLARNWLRVILRGRYSDRDSMGARVEARVGGRTIVRTVQPVGGYLSQHESPLVFGLDKEQIVQSLSITWPDGTIRELRNIRPNQVLVIVQSATADDETVAVIPL